MKQNGSLGFALLETKDHHTHLNTITTTIQSNKPKCKHSTQACKLAQTMKITTQKHTKVEQCFWSVQHVKCGCMGMNNVILSF